MKEFEINQNGQHMHCNWFCVNCNAFGNSKSVPHYSYCDEPEIYAIPSTAEVPRKNASKRKWEEFRENFVFIKPVGFWFYKEYSWWYQNCRINSIKS